MDTGVIPLVKQVVIVFTIIVVAFIAISFGFAKLKVLVTGKKPPKTGPELYAAQLAMQKNPNQTHVKKARIPSSEKKKEEPHHHQEEKTGQEAERLRAPAPPIRRNDEARRSRAQSRVQMAMVQKNVPKRNIFEVVNNQQANFRGVQMGAISYSPGQSTVSSQANLRNQTLNISGPSTTGTGPRKININFK